MIVRALADTQGNLIMAAARLGIHRATLYRKVKKFGLRRVG
jgi:transcriptional regulator of acetoin/glycerol metabolism